MLQCSELPTVQNLVRVAGTAGSCTTEVTITRDQFDALLALGSLPRGRFVHLVRAFLPEVSLAQAVVLYLAAESRTAQ